MNSPVTFAEPSRCVARKPRNLAALLDPAAIAVVGATERPGSVGAAVMSNLIDGRFEGPIVPVNVKRAMVFDRRAYARIEDVAAATGAPDLAVLCTPAPTIPGLVRQCGEAGVKALVIISAGFRETGRAGVELENQVQAELARFPAIRAIGPNCVGLIVPSKGLNASFVRTGAKAGSIAFLSQSGALCAAILGWAQDEGIGFSHFISVGNMLDVGFGDLLDAMADDPEAKAVVLYIEAITDADRFVQAARRCTARKPVIAYKAGRSAVAAKAAASHTGAMAGEDAVYDAAFEECGIIRVNRLDDLLSTAELLGRGHWPRGPRLAIVTNAGGPGVIAADALLAEGAGRGLLASLSQTTIDELNTILPACWSHANPIDVIGDASPERFAAALRCVMREDNVDAALAIITPQAMIDLNDVAHRVVNEARATDKLIMASWMGGSIAHQAIDVLQAANIPAYETPEQAVDAFVHLATYAQHLQATQHGESRASLVPQSERARACDAASRLLDRHGAMLSEVDAKSLFSIYGIPVTQTVSAASREQAIIAAHTIGYPIVLKVLSPQITHKTDVQGVRVDLRNDNEVGLAFEQIKSALAHARPDAEFAGVSVQPFIDRSNGLEVIVGVKRDATFGPIVLVGAGGITAEVMNDRAIGLAPTTTNRAHDMLRSLRIWPMLEDFRRRGPLNVDSLVNVIVCISQLIADHSTIGEAEANPVLITSENAAALDARCKLR